MSTKEKQPTRCRTLLSAEQSREAMRSVMRPGGLISILVLVTGLVAFAQQPTNKMIPLKSRVPAAETEKYRDVRDAAQWKNPFLIVLPNGVQIRINGAALSGPTIPVPDVVDYLGKLPDRDWFYGLVVGVQENSIVGGEGDVTSEKRNLSELLKRLKDAGVRAELWPSG